MSGYQLWLDSSGVWLPLDHWSRSSDRRSTFDFSPGRRAGRTHEGKSGEVEELRAKLRCEWRNGHSCHAVSAGIRYESC